MSKANRNLNKGRGGRERHISVRAVRRNPPDLRKLSRAVIQLAMEQAAAEAAAQADAAKGGDVAETGTEQPNA
jgi:hypothetical protein